MKLLKACNPVKLFRFIQHKLKKRIHNKLKELNKDRQFAEFRNKYIKQSEKIYYSYNELNENPPDADVYIVGSDQVWNPAFLNKARTRAYFLGFGKTSVKRISYAASFGKDKLKDGFITEIVPLLNKFLYVSVREKSGLAICRQCGINNAEWVPDPTMLFDGNTYRSLYQNEPVKRPKKPYCFLYMLGNRHDFSIQMVYDWANEKNIDVVYVTGNAKYDSYEKVYTTIPEWVYLIDNADYVITNSFHCSVFSLLFKKRFGVIPSKGELRGMNDRFISLFEMFEIEERFIDNDFNVLEKNHQDLVQNSFAEMRNSCKLLNILKR
ncbi:hypothetical protein AGMMS50267_13020 [Spirochaetia bacterium]|nr:hypothetical protein AGMMS50267_13020 [Spirochaetia bacterium]